MSGLLAWSAVTALASSHPIGHLSPQSWAVGAVLATGAALLPDLLRPLGRSLVMARNREYGDATNPTVTWVIERRIGFLQRARA